jgi:Holliday junction resolvase RusA-like endonuclease
MLKFEIKQLPPSVNQIYKRSKYGGVYLNKKAVDFKKLIKKELENYEFSKTYKELRVEILYSVTKKNIDVDNLNKVMLDSMNEIVFDDDSQIYELFVKKQLAKLPMTQLVITEIV